MWRLSYYQKIIFGPIWWSRIWDPKRGSKWDPHGPKGSPLGPKGPFGGQRLTKWGSGAEAPAQGTLGLLLEIVAAIPIGGGGYWSQQGSPERRIFWLGAMGGSPGWALRVRLEMDPDTDLLPIPIRIRFRIPRVQAWPRMDPSWIQDGPSWPRMHPSWIQGGPSWTHTMSKFRPTPCPMKIARARNLTKMRAHNFSTTVPGPKFRDIQVQK